MLLSFLGYQYLKMDRPLFLKYNRDENYYISEDTYKEYRFKLEYITNNDTDNVVEQITFPEHPELQGVVSELNYQDYLSQGTYDGVHSGASYGTYSVRQVYILLRDTSENRLETERVLQQAKFYFSDRTEILADIGALHLKNNQPLNESLLERTIEEQNNGASETHYRILKNTTIENIDQKRMKNTNMDLQIKLENSWLQSFDSIALQAEDELIFYTEPEKENHQPDAFMSVDFSPDVTLIDGEGNTFTQSLFRVKNERKDFNFRNLHRYVKDREKRADN